MARGKAREQERQRLQALSELDRAKNTFFSNISHELRTPLTLMVGPLDELLHRHDGALDERSHELLTVARRNCGRLLKLVNALLDFSRIEAGRIQATFEPLDIARFTQDLVSVFRSAIERAGLELQVDYPAAGTIVYVDRHMWETIIFNLLSNALKYTLTGSIRVSLAERKGSIELSVSDTGTGIPSNALPRLFERFYRVPNVRGRTHEGTGIGLALVQELVRLHGGSIEVASEENVGTTFKVSIPTGTQHLPTEHIQPAAQAHQAPTVASAYVAEAELWVIDSEGGMRDSSGEPLIAPGELIPPMRTETAQKGTVLLVEDNADMRAYVQRLLARNFHIRTATDGEDALEQIRQNCPDLVLSDVMMPRLDGFGLLKAIRSEPQLRELPVILLSARAGEEAHIEGLEQGADDYLVKPFTARELEARVQAQLNLARLRGAVNAALREADRRKDEFLATLAHELRNPLAPIRQAARIASLPNVSTAQLRWSTDIINRQTQHMAVLLDDLLDLSRITRGRLELRKAPVELVPIIETAVETARPLIEARQHTLSVDVSSELIPLYVDSLRIAQALANLLTNAAKYTDPGGHIRLHAVCDGDDVIIRVSDTGIGIPPDKLSHVFEMFSQVESPIDRSEGGLGIGLALVKGVIELHGGHVFAMSAGLGMGSTFTIVLPRAKRTSPDASAVSRSESRTPGRKQKVLIVDDNRDAAASLAALLQSEGHETRVAFSPEDGLALAQTFRPNSAVLDIGMPRINGYELARRVRAAYPDGGLCLIAVTGWGQSEDKRQAEAAGFDHHLTKPVDFEALLAALDTRR